MKSIWLNKNGKRITFHWRIGDEQLLRPHISWAAGYGAPIRRLGFLPLPAFRLDD